MSLNRDPELKKAILSLPEVEKDKLLARLVGKDPMLMNQLRFKLLEDEFDLEQRVVAVQQQLEHLFERIPTYIHNTNSYQDAHQLLGELKYASGIINEHFAITKDKMSEIGLRLFLVSQSFLHFANLFAPHPYEHNRKLLQYQSARLKYILGKYRKLHEDLQFEFREILDSALAFAHESGMAPYMKALGLPKETD